MFRCLFYCLLLLCICGCRATPQAAVQTGALLVDEDFTSTFEWDTRAQAGVQIGVFDGAYRMFSPVNQYVRGFNSRVDSDVVIQVHARQLSAAENNAYGVVCRASPSNLANGYYFLVGGDGTYSIRRGKDNAIDPLISWAGSAAVHRSAARNVIRAVCVADYLALYVNGEFVASARDSTYRTGFTGFVVAAGRASEVEVEFDNLKIWQGILGN